MKYNEVVLTTIGSLSAHGRSGDRTSSSSIAFNIYPKDESSSISGYNFSLPQNELIIRSFNEVPYQFPTNKVFENKIITDHISGISGFIDSDPEILLNLSAHQKTPTNSILSTVSTNITTDASIVNGTSYRKLFVNIASGGLIISDDIGGSTYNQNYSSISNLASSSILTDYSGVFDMQTHINAAITISPSFNIRQETETEVAVLTDEISGASGRLSTFSNDYTTPYIYSRDLTLQSGFSGIYVHEAEIVGVVDTSYHHPTNYKTGEPCPEAQLGALVGNQTPCSGRPPSIVYRRNNISV
jgi:hypothetical protein